MPANHFVTVHTGHIDNGANDYFRYYGDGDGRNGAGVAILQSMLWWGDADLAEEWALKSHYASPNLNIDGGTGGDEEQVAFAYDFYLPTATRYLTKRKPDDYHNFDRVDGEVHANWSGGYAVDYSTFSGITLNRTGTRNGTDLLTTEAGGSSTFTIVLDTAPTANVTVSITGLKTQEGSLDTDTLTFTTANWDTPQTVTVTGVDDAYANGDYTYSLIATASNSGGYAGTESDTTTVKNTDDDTNGITITQTGTTDGSGNLLTTEAGGSSTFTVVLNAAPTADVTVSITGNDTTENSLSTNTLTFTAANWNTAQTITVTGVNDDIDDGDITTTLTATANNAGGYAGTESDTTTVKNTDDDTNGITITQTGTTDGSGNLLTTEAGGSSTFTVVLNAAPTADVTVSISGNDTTEGSLNSNTLSFTPRNWNTPQEVKVKGLSDKIVDGNISYILRAKAKSRSDFPQNIRTSISVVNQDQDDCSSNNLLENSDFQIANEKVNSRIKKNGWSKVANIPGWSLKNSGEVWRKGFEKIHPPLRSSNHFIELDAKRSTRKNPNPDRIEQSIKTIKGNTYQLSFFLRKRREHKQETLGLSWIEDQKAISTQTIQATSRTAWQQHQYEFQASSEKATIRFQELASEDDAFGILISNIKLTTECSKEKEPLIEDRKETNNVLMTEEEHANDAYLLVDTSTSIHHRGSKNRHKSQILIVLQSLAQNLVNAGYQINSLKKETPLTSKDFLHELFPVKIDQLTQKLNNYQIISDPKISESPKPINFHIITYDYGVRHQNFYLSRKNLDSGIGIMKKIVQQSIASERLGKSTTKNRRWKSLNLPQPTDLDLYQANTKSPSNLYAGTEMLGALEGLEYLLDQKVIQKNSSKSSTNVSVVIDGKPERRSWWDTRVNSVSDSIIGTPIPLPASLGGEEITTSGLLYDNDGNPLHLKNNSGQWQWKQMQNHLNAALDRLADQTSNPKKTNSSQDARLGQQA